MLRKPASSGPVGDGVSMSRLPSGYFALPDDCCSSAWM
jgi:hypothetical protein